MDSFLEDKKPEPKGVNYGLLIGVVVGLLLIGAAALLIALQPPAEDQRAKMLEGAFTEGSREFAAVTKDIIIATDADRTVESPNALGTVSMFIVGSIRNKGPKTLTALEVNVSVIDLQNNVLKEKRIVVVPIQHPQLGPNETIKPVTLSLEGFDPKVERANIRWKVTALKTAD